MNKKLTIFSFTGWFYYKVLFIFMIVFQWDQSVYLLENKILRGYLKNSSLKNIHKWEFFAMPHLALFF